MRTLTISLFVLAFGVSAQNIFKADMYVQSILEDTTTCQHQTVLWGFKGDSVGFILDRQRVFVTEKPQPYYKAHPEAGDVVIVLDELGQRYSIRYRKSDEGFIIWISGIGVPGPHFILSTDNICHD